MALQYTGPTPLCDAKRLSALCRQNVQNAIQLNADNSVIAGHDYKHKFSDDDVKMLKRQRDSTISMTVYQNCDLNIKKMKREIELFELGESRGMTELRNGLNNLNKAVDNIIAQREEDDRRRAAQQSMLLPTDSLNSRMLKIEHQLARIENKTSGEGPYQTLPYVNNPTELPYITTYSQFCRLNDRLIVRYLQAYGLQNVSPRTSLANYLGINIDGINLARNVGRLRTVIRVENISRNHRDTPSPKLPDFTDFDSLDGDSDSDSFTDGSSQMDEVPKRSPRFPIPDNTGADIDGNQTNDADQLKSRATQPETPKQPQYNYPPLSCRAPEVNATTTPTSTTGNAINQPQAALSQAALKVTPTTTLTNNTGSFFNELNESLAALSPAVQPGPSQRPAQYVPYDYPSSSSNYTVPQSFCSYGNQRGYCEPFNLYQHSRETRRRSLKRLAYIGHSDYTQQ